MARSISDEELQLRKRARRRLVGAIVLVAAVVVALPMVLDTEPKPVSQDINIRIPSPDAGTFTSKVVPVAPAPASKPVEKPAESKTTAKSAPAMAEKPPAAPAAERAAKDAPAGAPASQSGAKPAPEAAKPAAPAAASGAAKATRPVAGQYVLQVIALADAGKAKQIQQRIAGAGIKSYTEVVKTAQGEVTRVRAGPFDTGAAAEKVRGELQKIEYDGKKLDGKVIQVK